MIEVLDDHVLLQVDVWGESSELAPVGRALDQDGDMDGARVMWSGPRTWLVRAPLENRANVVEALAGLIGEGGAITEVTAGYARIRVKTPDWRALLMISGVFDAESPKFERGCVAGTLIDHLPVHLDVVEEDTVEVYVAPSYAPHLRALWVQA